MSGTLFTLPGCFAVNGSGVPRAAATLTFTQAGTSTACNVYTTAALTVAAGTSGVVTADSAGQFVAIYLDPSTAYDYKCVLKDSGGTTIATWDNIPRLTGTYAWCGTGGGTVDVITLSPTVAVASYATGQTFRFVSSGANTGAVTVAVSGLTAKAITKDGTTALAAGDIPSGAVVTITYDGTRFQLGANSLAAVPTLAGNNTFSGTNTHTGAETFSDLTAKVLRLTQIAVTAATDITWQTTGAFWRMTGATTVNTIATPTTGGTIIVLLFTEAVTVNDEATSSGNLRLAGAANLSATADDVLVIIWNSTDSKWHEVCRSVN